MIENLSQEFQQKYQGTYLNVKNKLGGLEPIHISTVTTVADNQSRDFLVLTKHLLPKPSNATYVFRDLQLDYKHPKLGYMKMEDGGIFFVSKKSERQYRKGFCDSTLTFQTMPYLILSALAKSTKKYGFNSIYPNLDDYREVDRYISLFCPKFDSVPVTLEKFLKVEDRIGIPFDHTWAVFNSQNSKYEFVLFRELVPVGFIKMNQTYDDFSTDISELYFQEWSDFCQRKGLENVRIKYL